VIFRLFLLLNAVLLLRPEDLRPELAGLHPTDTELGRLSVVGGGSIYPTVQNLCLALRDQGVGTAVTTLLCIEEPKVRELLAIPDGFITACHVAVGYPEKPFPTTLTRSPVNEIVFAEALAFIASLAVAYVYAWRKGVFQWR